MNQTALLVIAGMAREARLTGGPDSNVILSGGDASLLRERLQRREPANDAAVLSFGIAGGLDPSLARGHVAIGSRIVSSLDVWPTEPLLTELLSDRLHAGGMSVSLGVIAGSDAPLTSAAAKADLHAATGALVVDMESHIAAAYAAAHRLPFMAVRVVCDPAERSLPALAVLALRPDGSSDAALVLRGLVKNPGLVPAMLRVARDAQAAFRSLRRVGDLLGVGRGCPELVELLRDVA